MSAALTASLVFTLAAGAGAAADGSYSLSYNPKQRTNNFTTNYGPTTTYGTTYSNNHTTNNHTTNNHTTNNHTTNNHTTNNHTTNNHAGIDCLAYFVELDELAEDKPDLVRLPGAMQKDPRNKACGIDSAGGLPHVIDEMASKP